MGVRICSRKGCSVGICRTRIHDIGYICQGCQNEFKECLNKKKMKFTHYDELLDQLEIFMKTSVGNGCEVVSENDFIDVDYFFKDNTIDF